MLSKYKICNRKGDKKNRKISKSQLGEVSSVKCRLNGDFCSAHFVPWPLATRPSTLRKKEL
jgi:hypothetical protein